MKLRTGVATCLLLGSSAAYAADHIAKVGEVMISKQGSTTSQFIEIEDPAGESFPNGPYSLTLFDAAGNPTGSVALTVPAGTTRLVIASVVAKTQFGLPTATTTLTVTLPANGQACFNRSSGRIHCLAWGTVTSQVTGTSGNALGASPPDGMSLQLVSGTYVLGTPSPGAANTAAVPDSSVDAGVTDAAVGRDALNGDAPGGNGNSSSDGGGCSVGAGASWFGIVALAALVLLRRRRA